MKIAFLSDIHEYAPLETAAGLFDKRIVGFLNSFFLRRNKFDPGNTRRAIAKIAEEKPDMVVFGGDAASCGQPSEFARAKEAFQPLIDCGIPILYTPGNHDVYTRDEASKLALEDFVNFISDGDYRLEDYPFAREFGGCRFLVFNAAHPTMPVMSSGTLDEKSRNFLERECAEKTGPLIAVCHFPIRKIRPGPLNGFRHKLFRAKRAAELLDSGKLDLVLCGHIHQSYREQGECCAGSLSRYGKWSEIEFDSQGFRFTERSL